jgi:Mlc titration factor MtfA (ptsG expression regulator)
MRAWWQRLRPPRDVPELLWHEVLQCYPFLADLAPADVQRLRQLATHFLDQKEFHGAQGLIITDRMALSIAAQAVLPLLYLTQGDSIRKALAWYDDFVGIVVHPDEVRARREVQDDTGVVHHYEEILTGEAMEGGPVMLSWSDVAAADTTAAEGYNVVVHEFAHKLDMRDGLADGCPPLPSSAARQQWLQTLQSEYDLFREQVIVAERFGGATPWLDPYGAENPGEFFAVASEAYMVNPQTFRAQYNGLAALLDTFYKPNRG